MLLRCSCMDRISTFVILACFIGVLAISAPAIGEDTAQTQPNGDDQKCQAPALNTRIADLEKKVDQHPDSNQNILQSAIDGINFAGGISAGKFYTSNAGPDTSDNAWLLSNILAEISQKDKNALLGFTVAVGETSTPSLLSIPANKNSIGVEYASVKLTPISEFHAEVGLLRPIAGYECSYTYNNKNAFLGVLASQQPYNAYGAQVGYDFKGVQVSGGYYRDRLSGEEYVMGDSKPNESWEITVSGSVMDTSMTAYNYHLESLRNLTGAVLEHSFGNVDLALNVDYWFWDDGVKDIHEDSSSIGSAFYITPHFGKFSLPLRLEYVNQGRSGIYLDTAAAKEIYAATLSPTYHIIDNAYIRADIGYARADSGFTGSSGNPKEDRFVVAAEVGYLFK